jgi:glutamate formiminotransferase / formiminotetrahydrofolate cyclodeaminase
MQKLVECVPNFSEGRDKDKIKAITDCIAAVKGVVLLDVDPGIATNRTVVTMVGEPEAVKEAAFQAIRKAQELIDMREHSGEHARMGATDVCPFVPVRGLSMEDCAKLAADLGERVGRELAIPIYLYEKAAKDPSRENLADVRKGEYEALGEKLLDPQWKPDFGPALFDEKQMRSGSTVIGAREFLIAWNFNLNTQDAALAHDVALTVRERGRFARNDKGKLLKDSAGKKVRQAGLLKATKAVGWYIDEYERAQISMNLTNHHTTPLAVAFDTVSDEAQKLGLRVTGAEIVGLLPLDSLLEAGRHYLKKQGKSTGVDEKTLLRTAVQSMGLSELYPFDLEDKIIDYRVARRSGRLVDLSVTAFTDLLASDAPAPGGGSTAALCGSLSAALSTMVANLTYGKKGYEQFDEEMEKVAVEGQALKERYLHLIDADTEAFNAVMAAMKMPKKSSQEKADRAEALDKANKEATLIPFEMVQACLPALELAWAVAQRGNTNSLSDAGVALLSLGTTCDGAAMNVRINLPGIADEKWVQEMDAKTKTIQEDFHAKRSAYLIEVEKRLAL